MKIKKVLLTATVQSHIAQFHKPLIKMLKSKGYEVHVAARNNLAEKNGLKINNVDKIHNICFDRSPLSINNIKAYKELKTILFYNKYDIIHCNTPMGGMITRLAARESRKRGAKVFYTAHGFHFYKGAPLKNWLMYYPIEKCLAYHIDKLITITKEDYKIASKKFKTEVCHIHGVGVNSSKYFPLPNDKKEKIINKLGFSDNQFLLLCTGELNKNKNQSTVIKAVAKVLKVVPNIKLLLAGNGPLEPKLKELVSDLNIENNVDFLGYRTDLEKYVNICDVVISASFREGLPLNVMEAMLCKKPVIASKNRGHMELVKEGETGFLVDPTNSDDLASAIIHLHQNFNLIENLGSTGEKIVQPFRDKNVANELRIIYK